MVVILGLKVKYRGKKYMIAYLNIEPRTIQNSRKLIPNNKKPLQSKKLSES